MSNKNEFLDLIRVVAYPKVRAFFFILVTILFLVTMGTKIVSYGVQKSYANHFEKQLFNEQKLGEEQSEKRIEYYTNKAKSWKSKATREVNQMTGFLPFTVFYLFFTMAIIIDTFFIHSGKRIVYIKEDADDSD